MQDSQHDIEQRVQLAGSNMFELLLFRLGKSSETGQSELYGINVFKVREILAMPVLTAVAGAGPCILGVADIRGQIISVIDLARVANCKPQDGPKILLVTEFARSTQAFAVESVEDIVRLAWDQVLSAEHHSKGGLVTSFARIDPTGGEADPGRLAQVLDVEQVLRDVMPQIEAPIESSLMGQLKLKPGARVLAADDSALARSLIEQSLQAMNVPYTMAKTGQEAWDLICQARQRAETERRPISDDIALVLTDLEMPEMDGFTLTRRIKSEAALKHIPVVIHSSLSGSANEEHVRKVGANAYIAKFVATELADVMREVLARPA